MKTKLRIEPAKSTNSGPCECCGAETRRVWGFVHNLRGSVAAYYVQWAVSRVEDHGALFDLIIGPWGKQAVAADRCLVTLEYRLLDNGPAFMVVDSAGRPAAENSKLVGQALARADVIGQPIAAKVFEIADAILADDDRIAELLGPYRLTAAPRKKEPKTRRRKK